MPRSIGGHACQCFILLVQHMYQSSLRSQPSPADCSPPARAAEHLTACACAPCLRRNKDLLQAGSSVFSQPLSGLRWGLCLDPERFVRIHLWLASTCDPKYSASTTGSAYILKTVQHTNDNLTSKHLLPTMSCLPVTVLLRTQCLRMGWCPHTQVPLGLS